MADKRILVVDANPGARNEICGALGDAWEVVGVATGESATEEVKKQAFHAVIVSYDSPGLNCAALLNVFRVFHPGTLRYIAAEEALKEKVMSEALGGHQFLSVPFDPAVLKATIERSTGTDYGMSSGLRELIGSIRTFPTIPSLYVEVGNALRDPNASTEQIGGIISKDLAMTTKLVQVINSAYFGLPRTITDPTEAIGLLGFETVKSLIMTVKLLSQYDKLKPVYFSIDNIWKHSTHVARTARVIALMETSDNDCSGAAYTTGLMHDLGKVILAANFDAQYGGAHTMARRRQIPLWEVEKDIFGANHGEIGAYLLSLWGMPEAVVQAAALHHSPLRSGDTAFTPLTAVHVANSLEYEGATDGDGLPTPTLDAEYLKILGLEGRVEAWSAARRDPDGVGFETRVKRPKPTTISAVKSVEPAPVSWARTSTGGASKQNVGWKWLGIGLGAVGACAVAMLLFARLQVTPGKSEPDAPVAQSTSQPKSLSVHRESAGVAAPARVAAAASSTSAQTTNATPVSSADTNSVPVLISTPARTVATGSMGQKANMVPSIAPAKSAPVKDALDQLVLQGIFYSSDHPSVMIGGQLANVGQEVAKCRVLAISPSSVTLQYLDQRRTLTLK